jgi:hypothetical protein
MIQQKYNKYDKNIPLPSQIVKNLSMTKITVNAFI